MIVDSFKERRKKFGKTYSFKRIILYSKKTVIYNRIYFYRSSNCKFNNKFLFYNPHLSIFYSNSCESKKQEGIIQPGEIQTNIQLTNTYKIIIKSPVILEQVKNKLKLDITVQELSRKINVANEKDSQVIIITVQSEDLKVANKIANTVAEVFKNEVAKIMSIDNVTILSKAEIVTEPVKPRPLLNIGIVFSIGLILAIGFTLLIEHLDNTLKKKKILKMSSNYLFLELFLILMKMEKKVIICLQTPRK